MSAAEGSSSYGLKGQCPVFGVYQWVVRVSIILPGRFLSLNRLGFGYVGLASVCALVGPRRLGDASYYSTRSLLLDLFGNFKLGQYPLDGSVTLHQGCSPISVTFTLLLKRL